MTPFLVVAGGIAFAALAIVAYTLGEHWRWCRRLRRYRGWIR